MQDVPCARLIVLSPSVSCNSIGKSVCRYKYGLVTDSYPISFSVLALHVINGLIKFAVYQGKEGRE